MEELLKSDVFFVVTTIAISAVALLVVVILAYIIKIARDIGKISSTARKGAEVIEKDLSFFHKIIRLQWGSLGSQRKKGRKRK